MKVFIDLGAYEGKSLELALTIHKDCDVFYAFEPYGPSFRVLEDKFSHKKNVQLINKAVSCANGKEKFYLHRELHEIPKRSQGNSLEAGKVNVNSEDFVWVETVDFSSWIKTNFKSSDRVILKVDIEGAEYALLEKMLSDNTIGYCDKIYCEWHYDKIALPKAEHDRLVARLNAKGFKLSGESALDEFKHAIRRCQGEGSR